MSGFMRSISRAQSASRHWCSSDRISSALLSTTQQASEDSAKKLVADLAADGACNRAAGGLHHLVGHARACCLTGAASFLALQFALSGGFLPILLALALRF
jgi:hypothetical protein